MNDRHANVCPRKEREGSQVGQKAEADVQITNDSHYVSMKKSAPSTKIEKYAWVRTTLWAPESRGAN